jgi:hypothetical protein
METYTYWRTVWLWPCFLLGIYNTINYDQFSSNVYETSFSLRLVPTMFLAYLGWDMYTMMSHKHLYRTDLMIHHSMCVITWITATYYNFLKSPSLMIICECLSLMNYLLRNHIVYLNYYRILTIVCIRTPIWIGQTYIHFNDFNDMPLVPYILFKYCPLLFVVYDIVILYKIKRLMNKRIQ